MLLLAALAVLCSCSEPDYRYPGSGSGDNGTGTSSKISLTPFHELNQGQAEINSHADEWASAVLKMDYRSHIVLNESIGANEPRYPRIRTLDGGKYMLTWQKRAASWTNNGADTYYSFSDDLKEWTFARSLWQSRDVTNGLGGTSKRWYTNANVLQLSNGDVLAVACFWNNATYSNISCKADHGIVVKRSKDSGLTWSEDRIIYNGPCWEPHLIELPSGEIQCFFSESRPWISGSHSGTDMLMSTDGGENWLPAVGRDAYRVMRKKWWNEPLQMDCYTFQMPVGVVLNNSSQFAFVMESCRVREVTGESTADRFGIDVVYSAEDGKWTYFTNDADVTPSNRYKVVEDRAVAPYMVQFPSGETMVSYARWSNSKRAPEHIIRMGNAKATEFGRDFVGMPETSVWGGLDMSSSHSVLSVMGTSDGTEPGELVLCRFNLNHSIKASPRTAQVDGNNSEWKNTDEALFVGSRCQAQATLRCSQDGENLYFLIEVQDENMTKDDFAYILLAPETEDGSIPSSARRIRLNHSGIKSTDQYAGGWRSLDFGVVMTASYDGTLGDSSDSDTGFVAEISIPRTSLKIEGGGIKFNFGYFDSTANVEDSLGDATNSLKWLNIKGL